MAEGRFGNLVKAVVDLDRELIAVDADMHADEEAFLLGDGSRQSDLWGINLYPDDFGGDSFIEFDSMINIRPSQGNRSRSVDDPVTRSAIGSLIQRLVVA
ncbi:MAG: hypothetical protein HYX57_12400 [Chloroflexi bacterium]|nr:hypothetical protein [Chloroflexota bacterium]